MELKQHLNSHSDYWDFVSALLATQAAQRKERRIRDGLEGWRVSESVALSQSSRYMEAEHAVFPIRLSRENTVWS